MRTCRLAVCGLSVAWISGCGAEDGGSSATTVGPASSTTSVGAGGAGSTATASSDATESSAGGGNGSVVGVGAGTSSSTSTASSTSGGGGSAEPSLRLLTWNLEGFPKSDATIPDVIALLDEVAPDLIGVEEVRDLEAWQALDDALVDYEGTLATSGDGFVRVGLLHRTDRVLVSDVQTLFGDDDYAFPRPMLTARIALVDAPTRGFRFGVVHLKAQLDAESAERRRDACLKLDAWIDEQRAEDAALNVVVAGDYNDELTDPPEWNVFGPLLAPEDGGFLTLPLETEGLETYLPFDSFLDHVLVRGPTAFTTSDAQVLTPDTTNPDYVAEVSDHRPVVATIRWSP